MQVLVCNEYEVQTVNVCISHLHFEMFLVLCHLLPQTALKLLLLRLEVIVLQPLLEVWC